MGMQIEVLTVASPALYYRATPPSYTTALYHRPIPPSYTTALYHRAIPPSYTTELNHRAMPPSYTIGLYHRAIPLRFTTGLYHRAIPPSYTTGLYHCYPHTLLPAILLSRHHLVSRWKPNVLHWRVTQEQVIFLECSNDYRYQIILCGYVRK